MKAGVNRQRIMVNKQPGYADHSNRMDIRPGRQKPDLTVCYPELVEG